MSQLEILIDGERLDIKSASDLNLELRRKPIRKKGGEVIEPTNPSLRYGLGTLDVTLPRTANNERRINYVGDSQRRRRFYTAKAQKAQIYVDGFLILDGEFKVADVTKDEIIGIFKDDSIAWLDKINDLSLRDLSYTNILYTGVDGSHGIDYHNGRDPITDQQPFCFAWVAYGNYYKDSIGFPQYFVQDQNTQDDVPPSFYVYEIARKIFDEAGYKMQFGALQKHKNLVFPYTGERRFRQPEAMYGSVMTLDEDTIEEGSPTIGLEELSPFNGTSSDAGRHYSVSDLKWYCPESGTYEYELSGNLSMWDSNRSTSTNYDVDIEVRVYSPDGTLITTDANTFSVTNDNPVGTTYTLIGASSNLELKKNEYVELYINYTGIAPANTVQFAWQSESELTISAVSDESGEAYTADFPIAENLPDIKQQDFIEMILKMFNAYFEVDSSNKTISIIEHDQYFKKHGSLHLDRTFNWREKPNKQFEKETFDFANDEDDHLQQEYGNYEITSKSVYAEGERKIEIMFPPARRILTDKSVPTPSANLNIPTIATEEQLETPQDEVSWTFDYLPHLIELDGSTDDIRFFNFNGLTTVDKDLKTAYDPSTRRWFKYYEGYEKQIKRQQEGFMVECDAILTPSDFSNLKFNEPVKAREEWYYVQELRSYNPLTGECSLVLQRS